MGRDRADGEMETVFYQPADACIAVGDMRGHLHAHLYPVCGFLIAEVVQVGGVVGIVIERVDGSHDMEVAQENAFLVEVGKAHGTDELCHAL